MWKKKGRKFITTEICAFESQKYKSHMKIIKYEVLQIELKPLNMKIYSTLSPSSGCMGKVHDQTDFHLSQ